MATDWLLSQNERMKKQGIFNWTLPAWVVQLTDEAPDGTTTVRRVNVCPSAGVCASGVAALAVSHAGRVALRGGWASALSRVSVIHRVSFRGFDVTQVISGDWPEPDFMWLDLPLRRARRSRSARSAWWWQCLRRLSARRSSQLRPVPPPFASTPRRSGSVSSALQ
ncbi:hypothetical protein [Streptomyces sp. NPDC006527]|uniref:GP88 family protein n=1 Tax=Streptomyces sp. NPDC006527 TaxID=3364749 RepID=UPI003681C95A